MIRDKVTLQTFIALVCLPIILIACSQKEPEPISQATPIPEGVEIISIDEGQVITSKISQQKVFDQCESSSPFKAEIRFSQSSGQESQNDLVFKGNISGEIGLSEIAKVQLGSAIEKRFTNTNTSGQVHDEGAAIEVPAHTKQEYTIVWQEIRRDGKVDYIENGETYTVDYSYRIGVELSSSTVVDLECPEQETPKITNPTPIPTYTPYPTYTPPPTQIKPTDTPQPTATIGPTITPQNSNLDVGQYYSQGSISFAVTNLELGESNDGLSIRPFFHIRNTSNNTISFDYGYYNFQVKDNLGNVYPATGYISSWTKILDPGEFAQLDAGNFYWRFNGNYSDPNVAYLTITVTNLSSIEYAQWTIPVNH